MVLVSTHKVNDSRECWESWAPSPLHSHWEGGQILYASSNFGIHNFSGFKCVEMATIRVQYGYRVELGSLIQLYEAFIHLNIYQEF